jgi:hypothetical protein
MKTFEVELRRTSYVVITVEATSEEDAETKAWKELDNNYEHGDSEAASWDVESIEEIKE